MSDAPSGLILGRSLPAPAAMGFCRAPAPTEAAPIRYSGDGHALTVAPTGSGKGRDSLIPNALLHPGSLIVFDPKGEAVAVTRRAREAMGQRVAVIDPFGVTGHPSDSLNPLDLAALIDADRPDDAATACATLLTGGQMSLHDPFWDITGTALLAGLLCWLLADMPPPERRVSRLFEAFSEDTPYNLAVLLDQKIARHPMAYAEMASFLQLSERETRPSVQATTRQHLALFGSQAVRRVTDTTSFPLEDLVAGRLSLFLVIPPTKLVSHRSLVRLLLGALILALAARTALPEHRTLMLIDEAGQLGKMAPIIQTATLLRGVGVTLWTYWQSVAQIEAIYGAEAMVLADNAGVIQLFGPRNGRMAEGYARLLGDISAEQVRALGADEQMLLVEGGRTTRCRRVNHLTDPLCAGLFDPHPMHRGIAATEIGTLKGGRER